MLPGSLDFCAALPRSGSKAKKRREKKERKKERLNNGDNNGQATHGEHMAHASRLGQNSYHYHTSLLEHHIIYTSFTNLDIVAH